MEQALTVNQLQSATIKTNKFIPVPIRRSDPVLERCNIPTANSAYLQVTDSVTSFTSSISSSIAETHIPESCLSDRPLSSKSSLSAPLSRLLIPEVPTNTCPIQPLSNDRLTDNRVPSLQPAPKIISDKLQGSENVSPETLAKLLTTDSPPPSHNFLNYIYSTTSVDAGQPHTTDEPTFTVTSVKRSDGEIIKTTRQKNDSPKPPQDPYIQSVAMLTQLVTQNTHLVKTALDAISVAAIKPQQTIPIDHTEPATIPPSLERQMLRTPQPPPEAMSKRAMPQTLTESRQTSTKLPQRKPTRIPKPALPSNTTQYVPSTPIFTPNDHRSNTKADPHDDLIGVPIRAQEYMPSGSMDFLNALIKEENHEEIAKIPTRSSAMPAFDPFLNDLVNAASQLDDLVNSMCSDVSYTGKVRTTKVALS